MNNNDMNYLVDSVAENLVNSMIKLSSKKSSSLDRTYTGRIMSIGTNGKCQVMFNNKSCWVEIADTNTHYINELVRIYIPNGDIDKAYAESISPAPCSKIIISKNQMVFQTTVSTPIFSTGSDGEPKVEMANVDIEKVIELTRDSQGRPVSAVFPDKSELTVEYKD